MCVAPNSSAHASFVGSMSTAMIGWAPARRAPAIAALPTPPQPNTATLSPRPTSPVYIAAPRPAITPQPSRPAVSGLAAGSTLVAWPAATSVCSAKAPMPSAGLSSVPSASVIFCVALKVEKQYQGRPRRQARQVPHTARQLRTTKSPGATSVTSGAHRLDHARGLVPQEEREVVVDRAFPVVQVGVAHAARLHGHPRLARSGIGHDDLTHLDRRTLGERDHTLHRCCSHGCLSSPPARRSGQVQRRPHRSVIRADGRQHRAVDHHDAVVLAHEDVVDLAVRSARRPRAAAHGARPSGQERRDARDPRNCSHRRRWRDGPRRGAGRQPSQLDRRPVGEARREVDADEVDLGAADVEDQVQSTAFGVWSLNTMPTGSRPATSAGMRLRIARPTVPRPSRSRGTCGHGSSFARPNGSSNTSAPISSPTRARQRGRRRGSTTPAPRSRRRRSLVGPRRGRRARRRRCAGPAAPRGS